jgi:hypothetical protein
MDGINEQVEQAFGVGIVAGGYEIQNPFHVVLCVSLLLQSQWGYTINKIPHTFIPIKYTPEHLYSYIKLYS